MYYINFTKSYLVSMSFANLTNENDFKITIVLLVEYKYMRIFTTLLILCHNIVVNLSDLSRIFILYSSVPIYYRGEFLQRKQSQNCPLEDPEGSTCSPMPTSPNWKTHCITLSPDIQSDGHAWVLPSLCLLWT